MKEWLDFAIRARMPLLGHDDTYFLGSGTVGASGDGRGVWSFAIGPDYTCPNFLQSEVLSLTTRSGTARIPFEMRRLRGCGAFFGLAVMDGVRVTVTEVCIPGWANLLRLLTFENDAQEEIRLQLCVDVVQGGERQKTFAGPGDGEGAYPGVQILSPEDEWCFGNCETHSWAERRLKVTMPDCGVTRHGSGWRLKRKLIVPAGGMVSVPLWHDFAYGARYEPDMDAKEYLDRAVCAWREWLSAGEYPGAIRDIRLRDAVESLLLCVKMQQNRDGGMIAGIRRYANSYIRDTHGGMRLLNICGHIRETEKLLRNIHGQWEKAGYIPNWWSMGSDTFIGRSFHNDASEITAYYLFMARDYLRCGGDADVVRDILPSLRWAADAQADFLAAHGLMDFNGDETEQYCVMRDGETYGLWGPGGTHDYLGFDKTADSFASTAAAIGSLEYFASLTGETRFADQAARARERLEEAFWNEKDERHGWIRDKDGLRKTYLTNYSLLPLWLGIRLEGRERQDALAAVKDGKGYLPNCPGVMDGFCGHTLGLALYDMTEMDRAEARNLAETILYSNLLGRYGTVSEFYGPGGTPNGHNCRPFEGGIVGEALVKYARKYGL